MNRVYKIIWSRAKGCYVVTSELAKSHTKSSSSGVVKTSVLAMVIALSLGCVVSVDAAGIAVGENRWSGSYNWVAQGSASAGGTNSIAVGANSNASGNNAVVVGDNAAAIATDTVAVGKTAKALASNATALGAYANAEFNATAIGSQAKANSKNTTAIGIKASATGEDSIAIGADSQTTAIQTVSIGSATHAQAEGAIAIGYRADSASGDTGTTTPQTDAIAIGRYTKAPYTESIAMGKSATVGASQAIAIGSGASAKSSEGITIGHGATAAQVQSISIGAAAKTSDQRGVAIGAAADAKKNDSIAIGSGTIADGVSSISMGTGANSVNKGIALGLSAYAEGGNAIAMGENANAKKPFSIAIGSETRTGINGERNFAFGYKTIADGGSSLALGDAARALASQSTAIGNDTSTYGFGSISIGGDDTSDAAYSRAPELQNFGAVASAYKRTTTAGAGAVAIGVHGQSLSQGSTAIGLGALAGDGNVKADITGKNLDEIKTAIETNFDKSENREATAIGTMAHAAKAGSLAIGRLADSTAADATAIGSEATGSAKYTTAIGKSAKAIMESATAIGNAANASQTNATAIGLSSAASAVDSIAIGTNTKAGQDGAVALGSGSETAAAQGTTNVVVSGYRLGNFAGTLPSSTVSIGKTGAERTLTNLAAGRINATSTDAINGSQLHATNTMLGNLGDSVTVLLGGNSDIGLNGASIGEITMTNIGGTNKNTIDEAIRAATTQLVNGVNTTVSSSVNGDGQKIFKVDASKTLLDTTSTSLDIVDTPADNGLTHNYKVDLKDSVKQDIQKGVEANTEVTTKGLTFNGDASSTTGLKKLGDTVNVTGDANITSTASNVGIAIALKKDLTGLTSAQISGTTINPTGVTTNKLGVDNVVIDNDKITGLDTNKITGDTDATNKKYVDSKIAESAYSWKVSDGTTATPIATTNTVKVVGSANVTPTTTVGVTTKLTGTDMTVDLSKKAKDDIATGVQAKADAAAADSKADVAKTAADNAQQTADAAKAEAAKHSSVVGSENVEVDNTATNTANGKEYKVKLKDNITLGTGVNAINVNGTAGTIAVGTGANAVVVNGTNGSVKAGKVTVDGTAGHVTGLENKTWVVGTTTPESGRAATEDQLKSVSDVAKTNQDNVTQIQKGWKLTTGSEGTGTVTGSNPTAVKADDTVTVKAGNNIAITQAGKDVTIATSMSPVFTSVKADSATLGGTTTIDNTGVNTNKVKVGSVIVTDKKITGLDTTFISDGSDAVNKEYVDNQITASAKPTTLENGKNTEVEEVLNGANGKKYKVNLADNITLGTGANAVNVNGTNGTITAGTGNNAITVNGANGSVKAGNVTVDGAAGYVTGLTNTDWSANAPQPVTGRAATEDQLAKLNIATNTKMSALDTKIDSVNTNLTAKGLDFEGNAGTAVHRDLGTKLTVKGGLTNVNTGVSGKNLGTKTNTTNDGLDLVMSENPEFNSVTAGTDLAKKVTIGDDGVKVGNNTYLTKDGINANNQKITGVANGASTNDAVNVGQLKAVDDKVTANKGDITNLQKGWKLTTGSEGTGTAIGSNPTVVKADETVTVKAGNNIAITQAGKDLTIATSMTPVFTTVIANSATLGGGTTIIDGNGVNTNKLTVGDVVVANKKITGLDTASITDSSDAANKAYVDSKITAGAYSWSVSDGTNTSAVPVASTVKVVGSANDDADNKVGVVTKLTGTDMSVDLSKKAKDDIATGVQAKADAAAAKTAADNAQSEAVKHSSVVGSDNITVDSTATNAAGGKEYKVKLKDNVTLGTDPAKQVAIDGTNGTVKVGSDVLLNGADKTAKIGDVAVNGTDGTVTGLKNKDWTPDAPNPESGRAATEDQLAKANMAVNNKISALDTKIDGVNTDLTNKGLDFAGNDGVNVHRNLGTKLTITGGLADVTTGVSSKNLGTKKNDAGDGLELVMSENPEFNSVVAGTDPDKKVTIGDDGVKVGDKAYITKDGLNANGKKITGVAKGTLDDDAVNVKQMNDAITAGAYSWNISDGTNANAVPKTATVKIVGSANGQSANTVGVTTTLNGTDVAVELSDKAKADIAKGVVADEAVKTKGLMFNGDTGNTIEKKLGDSIGIKGDENITTKAAGNDVNVSLNKDLKNMNSVETKDAAGNTNVMNAQGNIIKDATGNTNTSTATGNTVRNATGATTAMNADGVTYNSVDNLNPNGSVKDSKKTIGMTKDGLNAGSKQVKNVADGVDDNDAANMKQLRDAAAVSAAARTKVTEGKNISVTSTTDPGTNATTYEVALKDTVTLGTGDKAVNLDGVAGTVTAGTGDKAVGIDGKNAKIMAGNGDKAVTIDGTKGSVKAGKVTVDGDKGTVNGLTNTTWDPNAITPGQAATEDQLKAATVGAKTKVEAGSPNIAVNEKINPDTSKTYVVDLGKDLKDLNSVSTTAPNGNNTKMDGNGLTITPAGGGNRVSLTANGLNNGGNKITNVATGDVALGSMDAVNGDQLARVANKVGEFGAEIRQVGALGAALSALKPIQYDPFEPTQIMAGFGTYRSSNAVALGVAHYKNESMMMHAGVSYAGGGDNHVMANAGVTWKVGSGSSETAVQEKYRKGAISSVYALQDEVRSLKAENTQIKAGYEAMRKDNEELKTKLEMLMQKVGM